MPHLRIELPAHAGVASLARQLVATFAATHGASSEVVAAATLATSEAVANVVLHAYPDQEPPGRLMVEADLEDGELEIVIADDGPGLQPGVYSEGLGLGLSVIAQLADTLEVRERQPHGLEVWMRFHLPG